MRCQDALPDTSRKGLAESARNQDFHITNGDTFRWRHMFPRIAGYFGIAHAPAQQLRLSDHMPSQEADWDERPRLRVTAVLSTT